MSAAPLVAQAELACRVGQRQVEPVRLPVEAGCNPPEQPRCTGSQNPKPEPLDIAGSGVESQGVDDRVFPRPDRQPGLGEEGRRDTGERVGELQMLGTE